MILQSNLGSNTKEHYCFELYIDVPVNFTGCCRIISTNETHYYKHGKLHREDGPAVEYANGSKEWYINGEIHRENGPALEYSAGNKHWYKNGNRHRIDGPAFEHVNGTKEWYLDGNRYGVNNDFTNESWKHFQKTLLF